MNIHNIHHGIFTRIDPIIRLLLASAKQLQSYQPQSRPSDATSKNESTGINEVLNQRIIAIYKTQCQLFEKLREALSVSTSNNVDVAASESKSQNPYMQNFERFLMQQQRMAIHKMRQYILLPILLVLQQHPSESENTIASNSDRMHMVSNAHQRCVEEAALTLKRLVDVLHQVSDKSENDDSNTNGIIDTSDSGRSEILKNDLLIPNGWEKEQNLNTVLDVDLRIKSIVAIAEILTYLVQVKLQRSIGGELNTSLDKGEECIRALLACIEALCQSPFSRDANVGKRMIQEGCDDGKEEICQTDDEFVSTIQTVMEGQFLHLLVRCCLSVFDPPFSEKHDRGNNDYYGGLMKGISDRGKLDIKGNVVLKTQALRALETLLSLEMGQGTETSNGIMTKIRRSMFPGIFQPLFRELAMHLKFSSSQSSPKTASEILKVLSILLNRTLAIQTDKSSPSDENWAVMASNAIKELQLVQKSACQQGWHKDMSDDLRSFLGNVHRMIPTPLILLLKLIPTNKSLQVRTGALHICESLLVHTNSTWDLSLVQEDDIDSVSELRILALECLVALSVDNNVTLTQGCKQVITKFYKAIGDAEWRRNIKEFVISRIESLVESLPILAKSGRESELSSAMGLITGYLDIMGGKGSPNSVPSKKEGTHKKRSKCSSDVLSKFLSHKLVENPLRQCLVDIFATDSTTKTYSKLLHYPGEISKGFNKIEYKYMRGTTLHVAHKMVHRIATLFGYKRTALFCDECISILFEALSTRISHGRSLCDLEHARWLEKHFGLVILATESLKAFDPKHQKKKIKILESLVTTMVPMICSDIIWQLPSTNKQGFQNSGIRVDSNSTSTAINQEHLLPLVQIGSVSSNSESSSSANALNGNGSLLTCLMDLLSVFANNLACDFCRFIPAVLYPLIQKTSDLNSQTVQDAAFVTLTRIANTTGHSSIDRMLHANFGYLMETLISELNNPHITEADLRSQAICFYSLHNVIEFMLQRKEKATDKEGLEANVLLLTDMQASLTRWFNRRFSRSAKNLVHCVMVPTGLISVFISTAKYLQGRLSDVHLYDELEDLEAGQFRWEDLLSEFELGEAGSEENKDDKTPDDPTVDSEQNDANWELKKILVPGYVLSRLVRDIENVLTINAALMSLPDLKLQNKSCELFNAAFKLLWTIQHHAKNGDKSDSQITNIGNPLLQSVHKHWPHIQLRFQSAVSDFINTSKGSSHGVKRHLDFLLSRIIDIVCNLCTLCGEFIVDKFNSGIWPYMARLFSHLLSQETSGFYNTDDRQNCARKVFSSSETVLLNSLLQCIRSIFSSRDCRLEMNRSTSATGTIILGLLAQDDEIGQAAVDALKAILRTDCDCLWRALLSLSGVGLPVRPILPIPTDIVVSHCQDTIIAKRAKHLISFVEGLPEQALR